MLEFNASAKRLNIQIDKGADLRLSCVADQSLVGATCKIKIYTLDLALVSTTAGTISGQTFTWTVPSAYFASVGLRGIYIASWTDAQGIEAGLFKGILELQEPGL